MKYQRCVSIGLHIPARFPQAYARQARAACMRGVDLHGARLWQPLLFGIEIVAFILSLNDTSSIIAATVFFKSLNNNNNKTNEINIL